MWPSTVLILMTLILDKDADGRMYKANACPGGILELKCTSGIIVVESAIYGREDRTTCKGGPKVRPEELKPNTCKELSGPKAYVTENCRDKPKCSLQISLETMGKWTDPCVYIYKYLIVNYSCRAITTISTKRLIPTTNHITTKTSTQKQQTVPNVVVQPQAVAQRTNVSVVTTPSSKQPKLTVKAETVTMPPASVNEGSIKVPTARPKYVTKPRTKIVIKGKPTIARYVKRIAAKSNIIDNRVAVGMATATQMQNAARLSSKAPG